MSFLLAHSPWLAQETAEVVVLCDKRLRLCRQYCCYHLTICPMRPTGKVVGPEDLWNVLEVSN